MGFGNVPVVNQTKIEKWESPITTFSAGSTGSFDVSGYFSGFPDVCRVELICLTSDAGFTAGQRIVVNDITHDNSTSINAGYGITVSVDSDYQAINYAIGITGLFALNASTGDRASLTTTSWAIQIKAERKVLGDQPDITRVGLVPLEKKVVASGDADVQFNLQQYFNEYNEFVIEGRGVSTQTDAQDIKGRTSSDGGSTFDSTSGDYNYQYIQVSAGTVAGASGSANTQMEISGGTTGTANDGEHWNLDLTLMNFSDPNNWSSVRAEIHGTLHDGTLKTYVITTRRTTSQIDDTIKLFASSGNLGTGTFILYGKRKVA